jgi:hypothetical protein
MTASQQEHIRARAYAIWEHEGRPDGRSQQHWDQACVEITGEAAATELKRITRKPKAAAGGEKLAAKAIAKPPAAKRRPKASSAIN